MSKNFESRQTEHRSALEQLTGSTTTKTLKDILPAINSEATPPFALRANDPGNDRQLNVGSNIVTNPETGRKRSNQPINGSFFIFASGTITFPAASGGNIVPSVGANTPLTVSANNYINVLIEMNDAGEFVLSVGTENATESLATVPGGSVENLSIGHITLYNNAGTIDNITDSSYVQYPEGTTSQAAGANASIGFVVGNASDVTNGDAQYSTIAAAIAAASAGERITLLDRTFTENLTITKQIHLVGKGRNSIIDGTVQFSSGSEYSSAERLKFNDDVTIDNTVIGIQITNSWIVNAADVTDNNSTTSENLYILIKES